MDEPWVELRTCTWMHEAHFVQSVLKGSGIPVFIPDEYTLSVDPLLTPALGGIRVMVRPEDLEAAREVLAAVVDRRVDQDDPGRR